MKLRILYIITGLSTGGAEVSLVEISSEALRLGHKVFIISLTNPSPNFIKRFDEQISISTINLRSKYSFLLSLYTLNTIIQSYKPDIVHSHMVHANLFAAIGKLIGIIKQPLFVTSHSINEGRLAILYKIAKNFFNYTIHISRVGLDLYIERGYFRKHQSFYIPNGIKIHEIEVCDLEATTEGRFITLGRLVKLKNHKLMIDAVICAHKRFPKVSLTIFGNGPCYEELRKYIYENKADNFIFLMGETCNPRNELLQANFFLLSSDWEGMPMSLLEAGAAGLPCAVTDVGSCKEILGDLPLCSVATLGDRNQYYLNVMTLAGTSLHSFQEARLAIREGIINKYSINSTFLSLSNLYEIALNNAYRPEIN